MNSRSLSSEGGRFAVVVPLYKQALSTEEDVSLAHLLHFLGKYDRYVVAPKNLRVTPEGFGIVSFDDHFFTGTAAYSRLLLSRHFYEAFSRYEYILIYQLDCLVFSDQLFDWCKWDFDYVGAPWVRLVAGHPAGFSRVGNGGLSLRKISSFLRVIDADNHSPDRTANWRNIFGTKLADLQEFSAPARLLKKLQLLSNVSRGVKFYTSNYTLNEDRFWSDRARLFYSGFKVAPVEAALRFAFERAPNYCFEQNGRQLPFGCHAWAKWDREFWQPYLLQS